MKAASGELSLTVITIIAIGLVIAFFTAVLWPNIKGSINSQWKSVDVDPSTVNMIILK